MKRFYIIAGIFLLTFILAEIVLRVTGIVNSYSENVGEGFQTNYGKIIPSWYPSWDTSTTFVVDRADFKYTYHTNSLGMREREIPEYKSDSFIRIITIGDSYTEGMGAPTDSSWPRLLESMLKQDGYNVELFNAGISGSYPFFEFYLLRDKLLKYNPDMVLFAVNATDLQDYAVKGGYNSFHKDGTVHYVGGPWFLPLYKYSHTIRAVIKIAMSYPLEDLFVSTAQFTKVYGEAADSITAVMQDAAVIMEQKHITPVFIIHPGPSEIIHDRPDLTYYPAPYMKSIEDSLAAQKLFVLNLYPPFRKLLSETNFLNYAHKRDRHYNSAGYHFFATEVHDYLTKNNLIIQTR